MLPFYYFSHSHLCFSLSHSISLAFATYTLSNEMEFQKRRKNGIETKKVQSPFEKMVVTDIIAMRERTERERERERRCHCYQSEP